jgi:Cu2+-exporting ATPase
MAVAASIKQTFPVTGMSCAACATSIENITKKQEGILTASVNYAGATLLVEFNPQKIKQMLLKNCSKNVWQY